MDVPPHSEVEMQTPFCPLAVQVPYWYCADAVLASKRAADRIVLANIFKICWVSAYAEWK